MKEAKKYYIYQGKIHGQPIGKSKFIYANGPTAALKAFFPNTKYRKATQKEIFGSARNLQFGMRNGQMQYKPNQNAGTVMNWIQINNVDKDEAAFFILEG